MKKEAKTLPEASGVYRMKNTLGEVLYVGKTRNLRSRVNSYTLENRLSLRIKRMVSLVTELEITVTKSESEALLLEQSEIKRLKPRYNILLKDDKSYPYILMTEDTDYPRITRHRGSKNIKGLYFGPFASGKAVTETIEIIQNILQIRTCSNNMFKSRKRPCLQYHIKRCTAPCTGLVTEKKYQEQVKRTVMFLSGKSQELQTAFAAEMRKASEKEEYELAAKWRDKIQALTAIQAKQSIYIKGLENADVIAIHKERGHSAIEIFFIRNGLQYGSRTFFPKHDEGETKENILSAFIGQFYMNKPVPKNILVNVYPTDKEILCEALSLQIHKPYTGDKQRLIEMAEDNARMALLREEQNIKNNKEIFAKIQKAFSLDTVPQRIEVYDNSHLQGTSAVGAMIAVSQNGFEKSGYRRFNIKQARTDDDFAMMKEVLYRRFKNTETVLPDIILIDGGLGQVHKAEEVLSALGIKNITVIGIAKGKDRNAGRERFFMKDKDVVLLEQNSSEMFFMQRIRDEAHRFAITSHRAKRAKNFIKSELDEIEGIGAKRKKALLNHFGSVRAVKEADLKTLMSVKGISKAAALKIKSH